jgi:hypothetical protein
MDLWQIHAQHFLRSPGVPARVIGEALQAEKRESGGGLIFETEKNTYAKSATLWLATTSSACRDQLTRMCFHLESRNYFGERISA